MTARRNLTAMGFLVMAFVVVGLVGMFASFAAPVPLRQALLRDAALDAAAEAARGPDPMAALTRLAPRLGDSAKVLAGGDVASLPARIQAERKAVRARFQAEADSLAFRLRLVILLITGSAAAFGVIMAGMPLAGMRGAR